MRPPFVFWIVLLVPVLGIASEYRYVEASLDGVLAGFAQAPGMGSGAAAADYDGDGDVDLFLPTAQGVANLLLRNRGNGVFDEVADAVGLADSRQARVAVWYDYDGDGDLDLALGRDCFERFGNCSDLSISVYEQDSGSFADVSEALGLVETSGSLGDDWHIGGLSAGDVSGDGLPDLYVAKWNAPARLYVSDGLALEGDEAGYSHAGDGSGLAGEQAGHWQGVFHDFNGDDWLDLFVNRDFTANQLWLNNGDLTFTDRAEAAGADSAWNEMGVAASDYDNDGDIDLYSTNIYGWGAPDENRRNLLLRNDGAESGLSFTDVAEAEGVADTGWGWGTAWLDADNDGDLDLAATNGYCQRDHCAHEHQYDRSRFFDHRGIGEGFIEIGQQVGFDDTLIGGTLISADLDGDGRLDLVQTARNDAHESLVRVLFNRRADGAPQHNAVIVRPRMAGRNTHALGAVVRARLPDGTTLTRLITAGTSWMGQAPAAAHFGIGAHEVIRVSVDWPGNAGVSRFGGVRAGGNVVLCCEDVLFASGFE